MEEGRLWFPIFLVENVLEILQPQFREIDFIIGRKKKNNEPG